MIKMFDKLDVLAGELMKKETIESEEFIRIIGLKKAFAPAKA